MPPCADATIKLSVQVLGALLQLPEGYRASTVRLNADDRQLEVDVVFPDGPSELPPIELVPHYRSVWSADGKALILDRIDVQAATQQPRPWFLARR